MYHDAVNSDRLFAHELGHMLGLGDYANACAWKTSTSTPQPSLFSYGNGPRSWRVVINDPSEYTNNYFNCRSPDITTRDKEDFRAIYRPQKFTNNNFIKGTRDMWRLDFGNPPTDHNPSKGGRADVYNAYRWLVMHRAPNNPRRQPSEDCTYSGDYTPPPLIANANDGGSTPRDKLIALSQKNLTDPNKMRNWGSQQNGRFRLNTNFNTDALRDHEFIIVGITRGDHLAKDSLPIGKERSVVSLDLDENGTMEKWTLGEPSAPFRTRPCNSATTPPSSLSTTTITAPRNIR